MITTEQLAEIFETGLNALVDYENLSFKIWSNVGDRKKPLRQGNDVFHYITGDIQVSGSSITANRLVMGVNQLTVVFNVPVDPPKTSAKQTAEDLQPVKDGQYWFVQYIMGILSDYFQKYQALELQDANGVTYGVGIVAGVSIPQGVDLQAWTGNSLPVNVYIEANIVQGGIISLDIGVELDGEVLPFQSFIPDRSGVFSSNVYSGKTVSTIITESSAFAAEATIPTNTVFQSSATAVAYLLHGKPNVAHFLKIKWGATDNADTALYFVTLTRCNGAMNGVVIASVTFRIAEIQSNAELIDAPDGFQVGYFTLASSSVESLSFTVSAACLAYVAGKAYEWTAGQSVNVPLSPDAITYDEDSDEYRVYLITDKAVTVSGTDIDFEVENNG